MTANIITGLLIVIAIIHLLPVSGVLSTARLKSLYDISERDLTVSGSELEILMRHRAVLFGILGAFFLYAAFVPSVQPLAFIAALVSIGSFFFLAFSVGCYNGALRKVVIADVIASIALAISVLLYYLPNQG